MMVLLCNKNAVASFLERLRGTLRCCVSGEIQAVLFSFLQNSLQCLFTKRFFASNKCFAPTLHCGSVIGFLETLNRASIFIQEVFEIQIQRADGRSISFGIVDVFFVRLHQIHRFGLVAEDVEEVALSVDGFDINGRLNRKFKALVVNIGLEKILDLKFSHIAQVILNMKNSVSVGKDRRTMQVGLNMDFVNPIPAKDCSFGYQIFKRTVVGVPKVGEVTGCLDVEDHALLHGNGDEVKASSSEGITESGPC